MIEDLWLVLPLRAVMFQSLLLLISIAIESVVLQRILNISRKTATEYSAILNLLSTFVSWLCFFIIQSIPLKFLQRQLIRYVFYALFVSLDLFSDFQNGFYFLLTRICIILVALIVELIGLDFLLNFIAAQEQEIQHLISSKETEATENKKSRFQKYRESQLNKIKFKATFWSNFSSNIFISALILAVT